MAARKLLATLSSIALASAGMAVSSAQAQEPFQGLVTQLAQACLVQVPPGAYGVVGINTNLAAACCAVISQVGPENMDFLQAVARGDPNDPRLIVLDPQLVQVLLSCQQAAINRLTQLALNIAPGAGPIANILYS